MFGTAAAGIAVFIKFNWVLHKCRNAGAATEYKPTFRKQKYGLDFLQKLKGKMIPYLKRNHFIQFADDLFTPKVTWAFC